MITSEEKKESMDILKDRLLEFDSRFTDYRDALDRLLEFDSRFTDYRDALDSLSESFENYIEEFKESMTTLMDASLEIEEMSVEDKLKKELFDKLSKYEYRDLEYGISVMFPEV